MKINYITKHSLLIPFCLMGVLNFQNAGAQAETRAISGVVLDEEQSPLAGATVLLEGTSTGAVTDNNGAFELTIPSNATGAITISFVGYITEKLDIAGKSKVEVSMVPDLQQVDEVVVVAVGYGNMRKADLTGAITSVSSEDLKKGVISSSEQLLQGRVAGLTVIQGTGDPSAGHPFASEEVHLLPPAIVRLLLLMVSREWI
jgi:TonB-dependent starch-binding outer membrane protein SusC